MPGDRVDHLRRVAALLAARRARGADGPSRGRGSARSRGRGQPGDAQSSSSSPPLAGVGAHRGLDPEHVLSQRVGVDPLADQVPGVVTRRLRHAAVVTLAAPMEKFVIQGGAPLSGEIVAAGNKNAALPILAACLLTEEELVLPNVPRIRDTETQVALLERLGVKVDWSGENELRLQADAVADTEVDEELVGADPRLVPARRPAAGALRRGADAAAGRRLHRPPPPRPAPRRLPRPGRPGRRRRAGSRSRRRTDGLRAMPDLHGRALGDGDRERADGRGADPGPDHDRQRRLRAARPGPRPAAGARWARRSTASART